MMTLYSLLSPKLIAEMWKNGAITKTKSGEQENEKSNDQIVNAPGVYLKHFKNPSYVWA